MYTAAAALILSTHAACRFAAVPPHAIDARLYTTLSAYRFFTITPIDIVSFDWEIAGRAVATVSPIPARENIQPTHVQSVSCNSGY